MNYYFRNRNWENFSICKKNAKTLKVPFLWYLLYISCIFNYNGPSLWGDYVNI